MSTLSQIAAQVHERSARPSSTSSARSGVVLSIAAGDDNIAVGHTNIIKHCDRPFTSVDDMDATIIANWNALVRRDDDIWHLGDFAFRNSKAPAGYLARPNGRKHLIRDNHDSDETQGCSGWFSSQPMKEIKFDSVRFTLLHYAMRVWPASHHGAVHPYVHSHGALPGDRQSLEVSVDTWDFRSVTLPEIQVRLASLPERRSRRDQNYDVPA
jgi:calcineurin-like phosphoesterase family protein